VRHIRFEVGFYKQFMDRHLLKRMNAQKLESSVEFARDLELLVKDGHHQVNGHCNPDLALHRIGAGAEVVFDAQVAFDPFEEEFDLLTALVELGNGECGNLQVVGEEDKMLSLPPSPRIRSPL